MVVKIVLYRIVSQAPPHLVEKSHITPFYRFQKMEMKLTPYIQCCNTRLYPTGDKNYTPQLIITSEIYRGPIIFPKALILQDECF